jgi:hypothetical protein
MTGGVLTDAEARALAEWWLVPDAQADELSDALWVAAVDGHGGTVEAMARYILARTEPPPPTKMPRVPSGKA